MLSHSWKIKPAGLLRQEEAWEGKSKAFFLISFWYQLYPCNYRWRRLPLGSQASVTIIPYIPLQRLSKYIWGYGNGCLWLGCVLGKIFFEKLCQTARAFKNGFNHSKREFFLFLMYCIISSILLPNLDSYSKVINLICRPKGKRRNYDFSGFEISKCLCLGIYEKSVLAFHFALNIDQLSFHPG